MMRIVIISDDDQTRQIRKSGKSNWQNYEVRLALASRDLIPEKPLGLRRPFIFF